MNLVINSPKSAIALNIFDYNIYWYGIILTLSITVGLILSIRLIEKRFDIKKANDFLDFSPFLIISAIIGARLFFVIGSFEYYINNPKEIIMIHHGGISIYGAILFGIIALFIYLKKNHLDKGAYFDIVSIVMPLSQSIGRWGNYFNQEAYGNPTTKFIQLYIDYQYRQQNFKNTQYYHPTFLYESVLDLILFFVLLSLFYKYKNLKKGTIFFLYLILYGIIRIFTEQLRMDSVCNIYSIPSAVIISFIAIISGIVGLILLYKNRESATK